VDKRILLAKKVRRIFQKCVDFSKSAWNFPKCVEISGNAVEISGNAVEISGNAVEISTHFWKILRTFLANRILLSTAKKIKPFHWLLEYMDQ
jgi:hypothetical protein